jgi:hypothetical protein
MAEQSTDKLEFKDVIVWHRPSFSRGTLEAAGKLAKESGKPVIVLGPDERIESLDEDALLRAGWMRVLTPAEAVALRRAHFEGEVEPIVARLLTAADVAGLVKP